MVPLAGTAKEIEICRDIIDHAAAEVFAESGQKIDYLVGTMVELPRAVICAEKLGEAAEFFSFGTNDLTQTALGISRDDAANFMHAYEEQGIYHIDPFVSIDVEGVGELVKMGVAGGRKARADIKLGICGEHGGDPKSIHFCETVALDYVSCSPFRVPIARLAAAQAALAKKD
jgi:pyruvate,orthophosphate dikinase